MKSICGKKPDRVFSRGWTSISWWITQWLQNDYPLAPEKLVVCSDMLPTYCKKIAHKYEIKVGDVKKLILN